MKHSIIPIIAVLLASSCNMNRLDVPSMDIPVSTSIACAPSTKAPLTVTVLPTSRAVVMAAYHNAQQGSSANYFKDVTFSYSTGTFWACDKYWPLNGSLDFLGYSLDNNSRVSSVTWGTGTKGYTSSVQLTLADNHTNQDDLLVGGSAANTSSSTAMALKHAQSLLTFKARANVAYNATTNMGITITDLKVNNAYYSGTVLCTRSGGDIIFAWSAMGSQQTAMTLPAFASTNLTSTTSFASLNGTPGVLVVPQDATAFTVYYTLHNGKDDKGNNIDNPMQYTYNPTSGATWDPMKKYVYNIDMTLTGITVSLSITDWSNAPETTVEIPE